MEYITIDQLPALFGKIADRFAENEAMLCEMDSKMGDGDLGLTMKKGFGALPAFFEQCDEEDLSKKLRKGGMEVTDVVPSTMGMLMGTGLSFGGKALAGKDRIDGEGLALFLRGYCDGIIKRGKCAPGDRTVLDCYDPAANAAKEAADGGASLEEVMKSALEGARQGVEATKTMKPKYGKAAVHANVSEGVADQGATAGLVMIEGMADYII